MAFLGLAAALPCRPVAAQQDKDLESVAMEWLDLLKAEQFDSAAARVATIMQDNMGGPQLAMIWPQILEKFGDLEKTAPINRIQQGDYTVVQLLGTFAKGPHTIRVAFDNDGFVTGFFVLEPPAAGG